MAILSVFQRLLRPKQKLSTRLWRAGGLLAVFLGTICAGNLFVPKERAVSWDMLGYDFLAFYYGGTCAQTGHYEQLYDLSATRVFESRTASDAGLTLGESIGPWWNPPFAAWMFAPLSALPFLQALHVWWIISAACLALSLLLLCGMLQGGWRIKLLVPFLVLMAMPCFQAFCHGQNTFLSLLLLTATVWLWRRDQPFFAGLICALLFYKPQLGAAVAAVLCLHQGRRAIFGICLTGTALLLVNVLMMPGTLHEFFFHMPLNLHWIQEQTAYPWGRHVTLKAFWRLLMQGNEIGPTSAITRDCWIISELALLAGLAGVAAKCVPGEPSAAKRDRLICAAIAAMPLLMPFYFDYDSLLLTVAIVVYAADRQKTSDSAQEANWEDRIVVGLWAAIFLAASLYTPFLAIVTAFVPKHTTLDSLLTLVKIHLNPVIPMLLLAAVMLIRRGLRTLPQPILAQSPPGTRSSLPTALAA